MDQSTDFATGLWCLKVVINYALCYVGACDASHEPRTNLDLLHSTHLSMFGCNCSAAAYTYLSYAQFVSTAVHTRMSTHGCFTVWRMPGPPPTSALWRIPVRTPRSDHCTTGAALHSPAPAPASSATGKSLSHSLYIREDLDKLLSMKILITVRKFEKLLVIYELEV